MMTQRTWGLIMTYCKTHSETLVTPVFLNQPAKRVALTEEQSTAVSGPAAHPML